MISCEIQGFRESLDPRIPAKIPPWHNVCWTSMLTPSQLAAIYFFSHLLNILISNIQNIQIIVSKQYGAPINQMP